MRKRIAKIPSHYPLQMITLDVYAQHVYQYAPSATTEHLRRTVWNPLGLASYTASAADAAPERLPTHEAVAEMTMALSHESLYAVAPITTNVRCVGTDIQAQLQSRVRQTSQSAFTSLHDGGHEESPMSPIAAAASRYAAPITFDNLGLPFCACVQPRTNLLSKWPPSFTLPPPTKTASTAAATSTTEQSDGPLVVVVDAAAAEAVLRGSDLYAPGVITASRVFFAGEEALVAFYAERVLEDQDTNNNNDSNGNNSHNRKVNNNNVTPSLKWLKGEGNAAAVAPTMATRTGPTRWRIMSSLTTGVTLPPVLYTPLLSSAETTAAALAERSCFLVCVGSGKLFMGWKDVLGRRTRGVALRTDWTPQLQPSRATLRRLLNATIRASSPAAVNAPDAVVTESAGTPEDDPHDVFFLQNYSSMVPVSLLVEHLPAESLRRTCTVLDACAAPGGKTSLLLSLLQTRARIEEGVMAAASESACAHRSIRVVCCERSRPRQEQLMKLLHQHFPNYEASGSEGSFLNSVLELHCVDTNKYLKKQLAASVADGTTTSAPPTYADTFDGILLDPPCTGLGLRPKLLPHTHTIASIQQFADYQRKLFDSCVRHLRGTPTSPGVLVYSTCTTTLEENEANVVHFLRTYPFLRLARASTAAHHALCGLSVTTYPHFLATVGHKDANRDCGLSSSASPPMLLLSEEILSLQKEREAVAASTAETNVLSSKAPLLALRFMPRRLLEYSDPCEDSVGFFVAVFLFHGHCE